MELKEVYELKLEILFEFIETVESRIAEEKEYINELDKQIKYYEKRLEEL